MGMHRRDISHGSAVGPPARENKMAVTLAEPVVIAILFHSTTNLVLIFQASRCS